jgi:predicted dehydrogenase
MVKEFNIGLIGLGYIGKVHAIAYQNIPLCIAQPPVTAKLHAVLRSRLDSEESAMRKSGFEIKTTNPDEFFTAPLDIVDVCSPNHRHLDQVTRALNLGFHVYCEKPLTRTYQEALQLAGLAEKSAGKTHTAFVLRYMPAIRQMKAILESGAIGEIYHFRAHMFHGSYIDANRPMSWRLRKSTSGGGALMDLGAHLIDMVRYLMGEVEWVQAKMRTCIVERPVSTGSNKQEAVDVDDWTLCTLQLKNGAAGVVEVTRMAAGAGEATQLEVFGSQGALSFDIRHPDTVDWYDLKQKQWKNGALEATPVSGERPIETIWPNGKFSQGTMTNAHLASAYDFMLNILEDKPSLIDFQAAAAVQEIIEAAYFSNEYHGECIRLPLSL